MVPGHPFKGGAQHHSIGILMNPEAKRFQIQAPQFFKPPHPLKNPYNTVKPTPVIGLSALMTAYLGNL